MRTATYLPLPLLALVAATLTANAATNHYLFIGHPRDDGPGQIVQRGVERVDYSRYDLVMLGGDYTAVGTGSRATVAYLDAIFDLSRPDRLAALGNHDTAHKNYFTDVTGRPVYYAFRTNGITFAVLDTTDDSRNIEGDELQMIEDTVNSLSNSTHLVLVHHHIVWMADYPPLAYLKGDERIGASSTSLSNLNFYDDVYPLLRQAKSNGVEVICVAGDRTGSDSAGTYGEFHIEHTTSNGIHFLAAGFKEELPENLRTAITWEHDTEAGTLTWKFVPFSDIPRIPDEPLVITELHYNPSPAQGNDTAFIELMNRGGQPYDLSEASFSTGIDFTFPTDTIVAPGERILVAADPGAYTGLSVRVFDYEGVDKPASGEAIWLRNRNALEIDYVPHGTSAPWPPEPNNNGPSLMLIHPGLDNTFPENWAASDAYGGTPGSRNYEPTRSAAAGLSGDQMSIAWHGTVSGAHYRLDWTPTLTPPDWLPADAPRTANASTITFAPTNTGPQRFYRISREFH